MFIRGHMAMSRVGYEEIGDQNLSFRRQGIDRSEFLI